MHTQNHNPVHNHGHNHGHNPSQNRNQGHNHINCPKCGHNVDVNEILYHQLDTELNQKYQRQIDEAKENLENEKSALGAQRLEVAAQEKRIAMQIQEGVETRLQSERTAIAAQERTKAEAVTKSSMDTLQQELTAKEEQLKELNEAKAAYLRLQREKDSLEKRLEAENEQKLNDLIATERLEIQKQEANKSELKIKEKEHLIASLNQKLIDAQRKAEQGSMQVQGEVQELAVEEWLRNQYPQDQIDEIKKGTLGADCIHTVRNGALESCGKICFESKRTKAFQPAWIEKFKADMRDCNADIGVIVSQARPNGYDRMAIIDGVWVCTFEEFKGLAIALRIQVTEVDRVTNSQVNQEEKVQMLWSYLQSNEFRLQVEGIVEGFSTLKSDLEREKRAMKQQWKRREKQIDKVLDSTTSMYGSIRGIAGASIQPVAALEFDEPE